MPFSLPRWLRRAEGPGGVRRLPPGVRAYAIGDIHGCRDALDRLLEAIEADLEGFGGTSWLIFLGDYIDRGPASAQVLDRLCAPLPGDQQRFIAGNHERVFADLLRGERAGERGWLAYGGIATLESYGIPRARLGSQSDVAALLAAVVPAAHRAFLDRLEPAVRLGDYFFTHAGVRPGVALERQSPRDLAWIREDFLANGDEHGACIVHGHTISGGPEEKGNRIGIDTGCYRSGTLTALVLEGEGRRYLSTAASPGA